MRRVVLALAVVLPCVGCWSEACVIEREPWAPDLCMDDIESIFTWDQPDLETCEGERHAGKTCSKLGFTEACGRYLIRPYRVCQ